MRRIALTITLLVLLVSPGWAEVRTITATGEYRMGDNDTRADAKRLALQDAKRLALEKAGTYIESITEVKNFSLSRDELRAYAAGIVEVLESATKSAMEGETTIVRVDVTCKIDTAVVARQIDSLRKNEAIKVDLLLAQEEADRLRQELEAKTRELASVKSKTEAETVARARRSALTDQDANSLLTQARVVLGGSDKSFLAGSSSTEGRRRARSLIEQALSLNASMPRAHREMGILLQEEGDLEGAIAEYRAALRLKPGFAGAHTSLGIALYDKGDPEGAIAEFRMALSFEPGDAKTHANLGLALQAKGDLNGALAEIRTALRLEPDYAMAHNNLGTMLRAKGDQEGAIAEYRAALRLEPDNASAHYNLGNALKAKNKGTEAAREFREFLRLVPDSPKNRKFIDRAKAALRELE